MLDQSEVQSVSVAGGDFSFREIIDRHGPAVRRTCQRILLDEHEAEDAFQATFMILARRLPQLRQTDMLGGWLIGVARRVSLRARTRSVRQSIRERRWASEHPTSVEEDRPLQELRVAIREELEQLPAKYRRPLSLCYLEGLTHEEAAAQLDCPVGTVKVQLVRARKLLKERLDRRGVALGVAFLLFLLRGSSEAEGSVEILADSTVEAMTLAANGEGMAAQALFPKAYSLAQGSIFSNLAGVKLARFTLVIAIVCVAPASIGLAKHASSVRSKAADATARLSKVLEANCR